MNGKTRAFGLLAALAFATLAAPTAQAHVVPQACGLYANTPYRTSNWIEADGGRNGCVDVVNIHVRIRHQKRFQPDETIAEHFVTAANHDAHLSFPCFGISERWKVFTETIVGAQKPKSPVVELPCA